jgi:hypothetical protein
MIPPQFSVRLPEHGARLRMFRRLRGDEFLEARIIPKRIEHGIEPEQRRSKRHDATHVQKNKEAAPKAFGAASRELSSADG